MSKIPCLILVMMLLKVFGPTAGATALHDYVAKPDENYAWRLVTHDQSEQGTVYVLHIASQAWRTGKDVDRILWRHWLIVYVPNQVEHDTAFLLIGGGDNTYDIPDYDRYLLAEMAVETGTVTAALLNVPNQPLIFLADEELRRRTEDDILAFCWAQYLEHGDPEWLALLPMTKSAVRAMDTITDFCASLENVRPPVNRFVVSGGSKRGWTTWLTAVVDDRVVAIAPQVIDLLNTKPSMKHHFGAYGEYSHAIFPYVENRITDAMDTPEIEASLAIIDPYAYRQHLAIPKLILNSTGDQFFLPDSSQFYYDELLEPKYLRYVPNTSHGLNASSDDTLRSFYASILNKTPFPSYSWQIPAAGHMQVVAKEKPLQVNLWQAVNPNARDFRLETIGKAWNSTILEPIQTSNEEGFRYEVEISPPAKGWKAFFVELVFPDATRGTLSLTTEVSVVPETLPYADEK